MLSVQDFTKKILGLVKGYVEDYSPDNKLLARPVYFMNSGQSFELSEPVSAQKHGIVLLFTEYYDGAPHSSQSTCHFVPKQVVADFPGMGQAFYLGMPSWYFACKYLYINDTNISGHAANVYVGTYNNIKMTNNRFVLHSVYGV